MSPRLISKADVIAFAIIVIVLMAIALAGCGWLPDPEPPTPPPTDCRTNGCDAGEQCQDVGGKWECVEELPPMNMLLRREGSKFVNRLGQPVVLKGAIPCCMPLEVGGAAKNSGWPVPAAPDWRAFAENASGGAVNAYHIRLGPWFAGTQTEPLWREGPYVVEGGQANLSKFNDAFWDTVYEWVRDAGLEGSYVEVDLNDRWWAKQNPNVRKSPMHQQWNVQGYDWSTRVGRSSIPPKSPIANWLRQIVCRPEKPGMALGRLANVIWQDGNEVGLGGFDPAWTVSMRDLVRHWEKTCGVPVHMFGTNSANARAEQSVDYVERHGAVVNGPLAGRPTAVNEYNPNPPLAAEQWRQNFCAARSAGTYYWYWRHGQSHSAMVQSLAYLGEPDCSNDPPPPPSGASCSKIPHPDIPAQPEQRVPTKQAEVRAAVDTVWRECGQKDCPGFWLDTVARIAEVMNEDGECATGPWEDALAVWVSDGVVEEYHPVSSQGAFTDNRNGRYKNTWFYSSTSSCPQPHPDPNSMKFNLSKHSCTEGPCWDSTYVTRNQCAFCEAIGMGDIGGVPRCGCPIRPEGHKDRVACERDAKFVGTQRWWCNGIELEPCGDTRNSNCISRSNPAQAVCRGNVRTCTQDGKTCREGVW